MPRHNTPSGRFGQASEPPIFMRMGRRFPIEAQSEIASHSEGEFRDTVSASASIGKAYPVLDIDNGMCFPFRRSRETASRNPRSDRDIVSRWGGFRKACPALRAQSGMQFPRGARRETASHSDAVAHLVCLPRQALQTKNRLEREFQPVIPSSKCRTNYDCAPSRKKRRLK